MLVYDFTRVYRLILFRVRRQQTAKHRGIFATGRRLVVSAADAHLLEPQGMIQASRRHIRGPDFQKRLAHAGRTRALEQIQQYFAGKTARAIFIPNAYIQNVRLARSHRHDAVAAQFTGHIDDAAYIADSQTVAENPFAPRELIRRFLDGCDDRNVEFVHGSYIDPRELDIQLDARHGSTRRARISNPPRSCAYPPACATNIPGDR